MWELRLEVKWDCMFTHMIQAQQLSQYMFWYCMNGRSWGDDRYWGSSTPIVNSSKENKVKLALVTQDYVVSIDFW